MQETQEIWVWSLSREDPGEENMKPLQYSCLNNAMSRGAWGLQSMRWQRRTWLSTRACMHAVISLGLSSSSKDQCDYTGPAWIIQLHLPMSGSVYQQPQFYQQSLFSLAVLNNIFLVWCLNMLIVLDITGGNLGGPLLEFSLLHIIIFFFSKVK